MGRTGLRPGRPPVNATVASTKVGSSWQPVDFIIGDGAAEARRARRSLVLSLLVHGAIITALAISISVKTPPKPETRTKNTMTVSLKAGDGREFSIPKTSSPTPKEAVKPVEKPVEAKPVPDTKPVDKPVERVEQPQPQKQASSAARSDTTSPARTMGGGDMIWTPPVPDPTASGLNAATAPRMEKRIEMPKVELPKGASDPVLLSYDQGRFTDATAMSEASRLLNTGTITMAVTVDDKGAVSSVVVTSTSGSRMLDDRASLLIKSYTYRPAQDSSGKPHGAIVTEVLEWAKDGKFAAPSDPAKASVRDAEKAMPKAGSKPAMPTLRMQGRN